MKDPEDSAWNWMLAVIIGLMIAALLFIGWPLLAYWVAVGLF